MGTDILNGVKVLAAAHHGNHTAADRQRLGLTVRQIMQKPRINPGHN
jgi:hypothetical protein